jgi:hypothetical protein
LIRRARGAPARLSRARSGEGLAAFINRTGGVWKVERAAVANGIADDATPEAGVLVKVPIPQRYTGPEPAK